MAQNILDRLLSLQDVLEEKYTLEKELTQLPTELQTKEQLLERLRTSVESMSGEQETLSQSCSTVRINIINYEEERARYEKQISETETQREYETLEKEIKNVYMSEQKQRKDLEQLTNEYQQLVERRKKEEELLKIQEEELQSEKERIIDAASSKEDELKDITKKADNISKHIDQALLFKFKRIIRSKSGKGIVALKGTVCAGCQMVLPEQFVNDVRTGNDVLFCPYCSKILFYEDDVEEEQSWNNDMEDTEGLIDLFENEVTDDFEFYSTDDEDKEDDEDAESIETDEQEDGKDIDFDEEEDETSIDLDEVEDAEEELGE